MSKNELDEQTKELVGKTLSFEELREELNNTSPLQMSKKLIDIELHDQQSSLEIMDKIYEEFESGQNIVTELVNPMLLGIADGLIKHPKLNGSFRKTNVTPSRLVNEVNSFSYEQFTHKDVDEDVFLTQAEKSHYGTDTRNNHYDTKSRSETEKSKGIERNETITYENKKGEIKTKKTATVIDDVTGENIDLTTNGAKQKGIQSADMDHVNPINSVRKKYQNNPYLYRDDLEQVIGLEQNETYINSSLNRAKGDMTWSEFIEKNPDALTETEKEKALKLEKEATEAQNKEARKLMAKNVGLKGFGDAIVLILKPIWFEIKDMFLNGVLYGFDTNDKIEAFILRLKRAGKFIKENALNTLGDAIKDVIGNFIPMLLENILKAFLGMFKKFIEIVTQGFMSIKEAFKIMLKPSEEMSSAQKADAITKIIASAVVPILIFNLESALEKIPIIGDVATIIVSGLATTLVVWLLDQIDLFSVKDEKRLARVKEIFQLRIENIKKNTDIFQTESLEILAKQKLQFTKIAEDMKHKIENNLDVNTSVYQMADFMDIDLKAKNNDDFIAMLQTQKVLSI
ncbi:hypothetical protein FJR48_06445 [Sulfurimonas lithotrophica]|uniref:Uncharacterized protein n=1 Tax=Sulfurimonas lithotrophica TaxID=2590022 RepID=A0A5P8P0Z9_9BACT|nr:hypothetical protein [Sulfurimonas lithotrophica]QFR49383.1 hypothetical protein FJR48_06445 [Sulfurimonas lithotrophica]